MNYIRPKQTGSAPALSMQRSLHGLCKHSTKRRTKPSVSWLQKAAGVTDPHQTPVRRRSDALGLAARISCADRRVDEAPGKAARSLTEK